MNKFILCDLEKCIGCRTCALACSFEHDQVFNPSLSRIGTLWMRDIGRYITLTCQQCEEPLCAEACPRNGITVDKKTGAIIVNEELCIGCRSCLLACPFGIPLIHRTEGCMIKCDLCGGDPQCVQECPREALSFVESDEATLKKRKEIAKKLMHLIEKAAS
jgi:Fe-S-cluster-containing hydrogenase component 2